MVVLLVARGLGNCMAAVVYGPHRIGSRLYGNRPTVDFLRGVGIVVSGLLITGRA